MKHYVVNYMRETTQSFSYTRKVLKNLEAQARAEIARLGGNAKLSEIVDLLHVEPEGVDG